MKLSIQPLLPIGNYLNKRYGIEMDFPEGSSIPDNFKFLNDAVTAIHMAECPFYYKDGKPLYLPQAATTATYNGEEMPSEIQVDKIPDKIAGWIEVIKLARNVQALERFKPQVDKENNSDLTTAYDNRLKELQNG